MPFSASPGNTTLLEMLNLLVRKDFRDHTIYVPLPENDAKWGVHGGPDIWGIDLFKYTYVRLLDVYPKVVQGLFSL